MSSLRGGPWAQRSNPETKEILDNCFGAEAPPHELKIKQLIFKESPLHGEGPLTRPSGDLSHKGRGIHTDFTHYYHMIDRSLIMGKDTSPLVGEVARRAGEGSFLSSLLTSPPTGWWDAHNNDVPGEDCLLSVFTIDI